MSDKLPDHIHVFDLSDYGRPAALILTRWFYATPITALQVTWLFIAVGLIAALLYTTASYPLMVLAGFLLILKSVLDGVDGSLARMRNRPSRVGRFLDSVGDFVVNAAVYLGIAYGASGDFRLFPLALISLLCGMLHTSWYNYNFVLFRHIHQGDTTSQVKEEQAKPYPYDNPHMAQVLYRLYLIIYSWQDAIMVFLDRLAVPDADRRARAHRDTRYLSLISPLGLGFQLLTLTLFSWIGQPFWGLIWFLTAGNLYWIGLILWRGIQYRGGDTQNP